MGTLSAASSIALAQFRPLNDDCANARAVGEGAFFVDNHDATTDGPSNCAPQVKDVWWAYTASADGVATVTTCDPLLSLDSVMSVYADACGGRLIVCNDDGPNRCFVIGSDFFGSELQFPVIAGHRYVIQVGSHANFGGNAGFSQLHISVGPPCHITAPAGALLENEPCGTAINDGCNSSPTAFTPISCGTTVISGTAWADGNARDTDWYRFRLPNGGTVRWTGRAEFPLLLGIVDDSCSPFFLNSSIAGNPCVDTADVTMDLGPGSYALFAANVGFFNNPCGANNNYVAAAVISADCGPTCPCDWNHSGAVTIQDLFDFLSGFFAGNADFNNSRQTSIQDLFDFLGCFFSPPAGC
jgi:hypothetical protein